MSVLGIGVDLVECARIQHSLDRFGDRFLHRVFTGGEIEYSMSMKFPARHLAARFAAKEAVSKAFGTGIGKAMGWRDIDVRKKPSGEPFLVFSVWLRVIRAEVTLRFAASSCAGPENTRNGSPLGFLRTSMSRQPIALPIPVPNAFETASFAANRAAKWRAGNFIDIEYAISSSVKIRWRNRSPKRSIER